MSDHFRVEIEPPCGWNVTWTIKGQPMLIEASNYWQLVEDVRDKLRWNDEPIPANLEELIQQDICARCPDGYCKGLRGKKFWLTRAQLFTGMQAWKQYATRPREEVCVQQEEADRRAAICAKCPHNQRAAGCWSCVLIEIGSELLMSSLKSKHDDQLAGCEICGCLLSKKVHFRRELLDPSPEYPDFCWMKT